MKKLFLITMLSCLVSVIAIAQKTVATERNPSLKPVNPPQRQSILIGLDLPAGSSRSVNKDSLETAKNLLQRKVGAETRIGDVEVLNTPLDSMKARMTKAGWKISPSKSIKDLFYITKGKRDMIIYRDGNGSLFLGDVGHRGVWR